MKTVYKALLTFVILSLLAGLFFRYTGGQQQDVREPSTIPSYEQAVPDDFSAPQKSRVVDIRDAGPLMQPRLGVVKVADAIVLSACPDKHPQCVARALYSWTRSSIEHKDALLAREHLLSPEETILYREADDETMSILLASLLRAEGVSARVGSTPYAAFVEASYQNSTVRLDPSCANCRFGDVRYQGPERKITWVS